LPPRVTFPTIYDETMTCPNPMLQPFRIANLPPHFYYLPDFLTPSEEASLLQKIPSQRWTHLAHRRLQAHPSTLTKNNTLLAAPLPVWLTVPIINRLKEYRIFAETPHGEPNHVLINEYQAGEGIMPHEDGGAYAPVVATISLGASICLDIMHKPAHVATPLWQPDQDAMSESPANEQQQQYALPTRIVQEPRSVLVTAGPAYREYLHGIQARDVDEHLGPETVANWDLLGDSALIASHGGRNVRGIRTSLTYRDVLKVSSAASKVLGGLGRR